MICVRPLNSVFLTNNYGFLRPNIGFPCLNSVFLTNNYDFLANNCQFLYHNYEFLYLNSVFLNLKYEFLYSNRQFLSNNRSFLYQTIADIAFENTYDTYGNVTQVKYPGNFILSQVYDKYGNLKQVINGSTTVWELNTANATTMKYTLGNGHITEKTYNGNGFLSSITTAKGTVQAQAEAYTFNEKKGLLTERYDNRTGYNLKETFTYDNLQRLASWDVYKNSTKTASYGTRYDVDKIAAKTGVGSYFYNTSGVPHAVSSVVTGGIVGNPDIAYYQKVAYTPANKVDSISEITKEGVVTKYLDITYGYDDQRIKTVLTESGATTTTYFAGMYEAKRSAAGVLTEYYYIPAADGIAAVAIKQSGATNIYYVHKNHQGSIVCLTDTVGAKAEQISYDPWGRRRNTTDWSYTNVTQPTILTRGYTGHEHLDAFGLINMNGRVYDPILGVFLSPDNYIQAPTNSLNYNRFSYCLNNPLSFSDPSGWKYTDEFGNVYDIDEDDDPDPVDRTTLHRNLFGLSYPGGNNPKDINGDYYYGDFDQLSVLEYPAIQHDQAYDRIGATGAEGLFFDTRTYGADMTFVKQHMILTVDLLTDDYGIYAVLANPLVSFTLVLPSLPLACFIGGGIPMMNVPLSVGLWALAKIGLMPDWYNEDRVFEAYASVILGVGLGICANVFKPTAIMAEKSYDTGEYIYNNFEDVINKPLIMMEKTSEQSLDVIDNIIDNTFNLF